MHPDDVWVLKDPLIGTWLKELVKFLMLVLKGRPVGAKLRRVDLNVDLGS